MNMRLLENINSLSLLFQGYQAIITQELEVPKGNFDEINALDAAREAVAEKMENILQSMDKEERENGKD